MRSVVKQIHLCVYQKLDLNLCFLNSLLKHIGLILFSSPNLGEELKQPPCPSQLWFPSLRHLKLEQDLSHSCVRINVVLKCLFKAPLGSVSNFLQIIHCFFQLTQQFWPPQHPAAATSVRYHSLGLLYSTYNLFTVFNSSSCRMSSVIIFSDTEAALFSHLPSLPPTNLLSLTTCSLGEGSAVNTGQAAQRA